MPDHSTTRGWASTSSRSSGFSLQSAASATLRALKPPLPGYSELRHAASSLLEDMKTQRYNDSQRSSFSKRVDRLLRVVHEFDESRQSEVSKQLHAIKEKFESMDARRPGFGTLNAKRQQCLLDELHDEISGLIEEAQLQIIFNHTSGKSDPTDNFPTIKAHEVVEREFLHKFTWQGDRTLAHYTRPYNPDTIRLSVLVNSYRGQFGKLSVIYKAYQVVEADDGASKVAEQDLKHMSALVHENIASVIGVTKGYHGINGIVFVTHGIPLSQFLSYANTGSALIKCYRGIEEGAKCYHRALPAIANDSDITVRSDGHPIICLSSNKSALASFIFVEAIFHHNIVPARPVVDPAVRLIANILAASDTYNTPQKLRFLDTIATLGVVQLKELEVTRVAAESGIGPTLDAYWDIGWFAGSFSPPINICRWGGLFTSRWNPIDEEPNGAALLVEPRHESTLSNGWYSRPVFNIRHGYLRYEWLEDPSCFDESAIKSRVAAHGSTAEEAALHYCRSLKYQVFTTSEIDGRTDLPFFFHRNPSSRSNPREFWGFLSSSLDPYASTAEIEELGIRVSYHIRYRTYPIAEMWSIKYEAMLQSGLSSIPGGYPDSHIEEV